MTAPFKNGIKCNGTKVSASVHTILPQFNANTNVKGTNLFVIHAEKKLDFYDKEITDA